MLWSYVTDVEGNFNYWNEYIRISRAVSRNSNGKLELKEDTGFVFGGDSVDKGNGDIRVVRDLLQLQRDYPDRVHLIIGNRDANKLRFSSELEKEDSLCIPYWVPKEKRVSLSTFLEKNKLENTQAGRLKWMLTETMGAATTFETRREELEILTGELIDDEKVVSSFKSSCLPEGENDSNFMYQYLTFGKLMVRIGNTLIVHGGVNDKNIGTVPGDSKIRENIDDWQNELNQWLQQQIKEFASQTTWIEKPTEENEKGIRGGNGIMDYGVPGGNGDATVVYSNYLNNGNAANVEEKTVSYLNKNNIFRVLVGHQPHGDCPTVINHPTLQVFTADTSYSDMSQPDNRGCAVSEILINDETQTIQVHGVIKTGAKISYSLPCPTKEQSESTGDDLIGRQLSDNWWVKSKLETTPEDGKEFLICKAEGFKLNTEWATFAEIKQRLV